MAWSAADGASRYRGLLMTGATQRSEMAGESAQEKADGFAARRRQVRADRGYFPLVLLFIALALVAGGLMEVALGAWWIGVLLVVPIAFAPLLPSQREVAWKRGAEGERIVGAALDRLADDGVHALHDRRMPGSRANIDHLVVGPSGVVTIDAKRYRGKLESRRRGQELWVAGRNRSKLLAQADGQAEAVRRILSSHGLDVPVRAALCFVGTEWPLLFPPREIAGVQLTSPRRAGRLITGPAVLDPSEVERIAAVLGEELPPAGAAAGGSGRKPSGLRSPARPPQPRDGSPARPPRSSSTARRDAPVEGSSSGQGGEFTIRRWKRFGHDRLYANLPDGRTAGYIDVPTGRVVIELEEHAAAVTPRLVAARAELDS